MRRIMPITVCVLLMAGLVGCGGLHRQTTIMLGTPALMFDRIPPSVAATNFGRSPWPSVIGRLETVEETTFVEFYHDFQGSAFQEDNSPRRHFQSYRTATLSR